MTVAAIIPTIAGRERLLVEAVESVHAQTRPVDEIRVQHDTHRQGPAATRNQAVLLTMSDWLAFLDDDDLWYPHHIETLLAHAEGADVVYTDCELTGPHNGLTLNCDFDRNALEHGNYIPVTALVRRATFEAAGGFDPDDRFEDWQLWRRIAANGGRFVHVPETTWQYRFGADRQRTFA